jgi:glycosyltransferase involved in cell wall biosynthesis
MSLQQISRTRHVSPLHPSVARAPSFALLSTFPPTACGLATFSAALARGLQQIGVPHVGVVQCSDDTDIIHDERVLAQLRPNDEVSMRDALRALNGHDVVLLQHEYGIFGGDDGEQVLDLLDGLESSVITTLHTVPLSPSLRQRRILEEVTARSACAVTMTDTARRRLLSTYDVSPESVVTIPHGATLPHSIAPTSAGSPLLLTWGLIGPGKGIEWVLDALALVATHMTPPHYIVAGQTHPKVVAREGEQYRKMLQERARDLGIEQFVTFDSRYRSLPELMDLITDATCIVLPYDSMDQITSGVLVDAVAAGRPVIATAFPHAVELLADGAGLVVPHRDPAALARAILRMATRPDLTRAMSIAAEQLAPRHSWPAVAANYVNLSSHVGVQASEAV